MLPKHMWTIYNQSCGIDSRATWCIRVKRKYVKQLDDSNAASGLKIHLRLKSLPFLSRDKMIEETIINKWLHTLLFKLSPSNFTKYVLQLKILFFRTLAVVAMVESMRNCIMHMLKTPSYRPWILHSLKKITQSNETEFLQQKCLFNQERW